MPQAEAIEAFLEAYNSAVGLSYAVTSVPDEFNRNSPDIDALAEAVGGPRLAIEHTLIQTLRGQKKDDALFSAIFVPLSERLAPSLPRYVQVMVGHGALKQGMKWNDIAGALERWILANVSSFAVGPSTTYSDIEGVPFDVDVLMPYDPIGLPFEITRMGPDKDERQGEVTDLLRETLQKKHGQMSGYAGSGAQLILLLESEDWVLISPLDLYNAYKDARSNADVPGIDQVWLARFYREDSPYDLYCLDGPPEIMDAVNPRGLLWRSHAGRESVAG